MNIKKRPLCAGVKRLDTQMRQVENQTERQSRVGGLVTQSGLQGYSYVTPFDCKLQVSAFLTYRVGAKAQ